VLYSAIQDLHIRHQKQPFSTLSTHFVSLVSSSPDFRNELTSRVNRDVRRSGNLTPRHPRQNAGIALCSRRPISAGAGVHPLLKKAWIRRARFLILRGVMLMVWAKVFLVKHASSHVACYVRKGGRCSGLLLVWCCDVVFARCSLTSDFETPII
jgi:hypothetical protein